MRNPVWPVLAVSWIFLAGGPAREAVSAEPQQPALNRVQAVDYAILSGGTIVIKLVFRRPPTELPTVFRSYHPAARIVLSFADTTSELGKGPVEIGQRGVRSFEMVQAGTHTRLVINLAGPLAYESAVNGNELLITLQQRPR